MNYRMSFSRVFKFNSSESTVIFKHRSDTRAHPPYLVLYSTSCYSKVRLGFDTNRSCKITNVQPAFSLPPFSFPYLPGSPHHNIPISAPVSTLDIFSTILSTVPETSHSHASISGSSIQSGLIIFLPRLFLPETFPFQKTPCTIKLSFSLSTTYTLYTRSYRKMLAHQTFTPISFDPIP